MCKQSSIVKGSLGKEINSLLYLLFLGQEVIKQRRLKSNIRKCFHHSKFLRKIESAFFTSDITDPVVMKGDGLHDLLVSLLVPF